MAGLEEDGEDPEIIIQGAGSIDKPKPVWFEKEEQYLRKLQTMCSQLSVQYMALYRIMHARQTRLRLPSIIMSSFSGVASFGTSSFPLYMQRYVSITVGIVNITIAMLQTYESYLKVADIVAKSLTAAAALKKIADDINCELYIPVENRLTNGNGFLRDCYARYQTVVADSPPLAVDEEEAQLLFDKLCDDIKTSAALNIIGLGAPVPPVVQKQTMTIKDLLRKQQEASSSHPPQRIPALLV